MASAENHENEKQIPPPVPRRRGAPKGNKNALKTGRYTAEAKAWRRRPRRMLREMTETLRLMKVYMKLKRAETIAQAQARRAARKSPPRRKPGPHPGAPAQQEAPAFAKVEAGRDSRPSISPQKRGSGYVNPHYRDSRPVSRRPDFAPPAANDCNPASAAVYKGTGVPCRAKPPPWGPTGPLPHFPSLFVKL
jgi:hypothetical protein